MKKEQFLKELKASLKQFPDEEIKDILSYYEEMITDKVEQGIEEEEVINSLGDIKVISTRIKTELIDLRLSEPKNEKSIVKTSDNFFIVLMLCMSPALLPLGIAFFAIFFSLFITFIALVFSFGVASVALIVTSIPAAISVYSTSGLGFAIFTSGIFLILAGIFALLSVTIAFSGTSLLNAIIKFTNNKIKKFNKRRK